MHPQTTLLPKLSVDRLARIEAWPAGAGTWRFRLEDPRSGRQQAFADAVSWMTALQAITVDPDEAAKQDGNAA